MRAEAVGSVVSGLSRWVGAAHPISSSQAAIMKVMPPATVEPRPCLVSSRLPVARIIAQLRVAEKAGPQGRVFYLLRAGCLNLTEMSIEDLELGFEGCLQVHSHLLGSRLKLGALKRLGDIVGFLGLQAVIDVSG